MNKYFVVGFRKIKTKEEYKNKVVGHNHRNRNYKNSHENIDKAKTQNNIILQDLKYENANELMNHGNNNLKGKSRKLKKNSAFAYEMIIDCTPNEKWSEQDYIRYLKDAYEYLKERFKGQEIVSAVIHLDESKPHLHVVFSYFNQDLGKWNQRNLMQQKKTDLNKILKDFEKKVGKKYELQRGTGRELDKPLRREFAKKIKSVEIKKGLLESEERKVIFTSDSLKAIRNINNTYKKSLHENSEIKQQLIKTKQENKKLKENNESLESENLKLIKEISTLEKEKERFLSAVNRIKKLEEEVKGWKQAALKEREQRLNKKIPQNLKEKTLNKIKKDYNLSI